MHINKSNNVEHDSKIIDIIPFSKPHYENKELAYRVKPAKWIKEWEENIRKCQNHPWKYALVITNIDSFQYKTLEFKKIDGGLVASAPRSYTRVLNPRIG